MHKMTRVSHLKNARHYQYKVSMLHCVVKCLSHGMAQKIKIKERTLSC